MITFFFNNQFMSNYDEQSLMTINGKRPKNLSKFMTGNFSTTDVIKFLDYGLYDVYYIGSNGKTGKILDMSTGVSTPFSPEDGVDYFIFMASFDDVNWYEIDFDWMETYTIASMASHSVTIGVLPSFSIANGLKFYAPRGAKVNIAGVITALPDGAIKVTESDLNNFIVANGGNIGGDL